MCTGTPKLLDDVKLTVIEGTEVTIDLSFEDESEAFPFPAFNWTKNGSLIDVTTTGRISFGYPSASFSNISRHDAGTYLINAENFVVDTGEMIGYDTGSFTLNVLCKSEQ